MPDDARSSTAVAGYGGRLLVTDGQVEVHFTASMTTHGLGARTGTGEVVLTQSGDVAAAAEVIAATQRLLAEPRYAGVAFRLVADRRTEALDPLPEVVADTLDLLHRRELLQMRRPLPVEVLHPERRRAPRLAMRAIDLHGLDEGEPTGPPVDPEADDRVTGAGWADDVGAWLRVNNRAFADHPDQGAETVETFMRRMAVEHEDPSGFLVADDPTRPGELAGFCWTKVHPATDTDPELGEIYVIGVDPSSHGKGLGTAYVLAGLDQLAASGIDTAMLYVESDNEPARRLYDRLGFTTHLWRRVYSAAFA